MDISINKRFAIQIAKDVTDSLVQSGQFTEHQGNYIFDRLVDSLEKDNVDTLMMFYTQTGVGGIYDDL
jgi:polyhydroxyalkanoate synthesis regulator phasin